MKKKIKLEIGTIYRALTSMDIHQTKRPTSKVLGTVPVHGMVCFLGYSPGNEKILHLLYNEVAGWVLINKWCSKRTSSGWFTNLSSRKTKQ